MSNKNIRIPLDHPEVDAVDKRAYALMDGQQLTDTEFGTLVTERRRLRKADKLIMNLQSTVFQLSENSSAKIEGPLPETPLRPLFCQIKKGGYCGELFEMTCGYVLRVREYIEKLECKYREDI